MNLSYIKFWLREEWNNFKFQIVGALLLVISYILGFTQEWGVGYGVLAATLLFDFYLMYKKLDTITCWVRKKAPGWVDKIIMVILWGVIVKFGATAESGWGTGYWYMLGIITGHLKWDN